MKEWAVEIGSSLSTLCGAIRLVSLLPASTCSLYCLFVFYILLNCLESTHLLSLSSVSLPPLSLL